jgi:hypothetical protein
MNISVAAEVFALARGGSMRAFDQTPDGPQSFGYKVNWFALKTSDAAAVLETLELGETTPANWESGLAAVYGDDPWVFVSPPIGGWILTVSGSWPYPTGGIFPDIDQKFDRLFARLMQRFDDVQLFGSHRVTDFVVWVRARNGKPLRIFGWADGQVLANIGEQTAEEAKLGLADLTGLSPADAGDKIFELAGEELAKQEALVASGLSSTDAMARVRQEGRKSFPDEGDVVELAALWSIDPMDLPEQDHPLSLGVAALLPENFRE